MNLNFKFNLGIEMKTDWLSWVLGSIVLIEAFALGFVVFRNFF